MHTAYQMSSTLTMTDKLSNCRSFLKYINYFSTSTCHCLGTTLVPTDDTMWTVVSWFTMQKSCFLNHSRGHFYLCIVNSDKVQWVSSFLMAHQHIQFLKIIKSIQLKQEWKNGQKIQLCSQYKITTIYDGKSISLIKSNNVFRVDIFANFFQWLNFKSHGDQQTWIQAEKWT